MRSIVYIIIISISAAGAYIALDRAGIVGKSVCEETLPYAIGMFDDQFGIPRESFLAYIEQAEAVWEEALGRNIFDYDPNADFSVNLIFDERQRQTIEENRHRIELESTYGSYKDTSGEYESVRRLYITLQNEYDALAANYDRRLSAYNRDVEKWNSRGGAPAGVYAELEGQRRALESDTVLLEQKRQEVNAVVTRLNLLGRTSNELAREYNQDVINYRTLYGGPRQFDQGVYTGDAVTIYQFDDKRSLVLVLAHELGHALGMEHVPNTRSIMYYLMGEQNIDTPAATAEDYAELQSVCGVSYRLFKNSWAANPHADHRRNICLYRASRRISILPDFPEIRLRPVKGF